MNRLCNEFCHTSKRKRYLDSMAMNLVCPPCVIPDGTNSARYVELLCGWVSLACITKNVDNDIDYSFLLDAPTSNASNAASSSVWASMISASFANNFPRAVPGVCKPHADL